eukprot:COSAG06_NODE_3903_length_4790_cov_53.937527_6_plen_411_part_00
MERETLLNVLAVMAGQLGIDFEQWVTDRYVDYLREHGPEGDVGIQDNNSSAAGSDSDSDSYRSSQYFQDPEFVTIDDEEMALFVFYCDIIDREADLEADLDRMSNWLNTFDLPGICEVDDDYEWGERRVDFLRDEFERVVVTSAEFSPEDVCEFSVLVPRVAFDDSYVDMQWNEVYVMDSMFDAIQRNHDDRADSDFIRCVQTMMPEQLFDSTARTRAEALELLYGLRHPWEDVSDAELAAAAEPAAEAEPEAEAEPAAEAEPEAEAERPQLLFALLGSGPGQTRRFPVILSQAPGMRPNRRLQHGRPWAHVYLDQGGPFYTDACQVLRNTWTQLWTCDGSPHAANYRHSREGYEDEVADVALLPEALMNENGEPNDDVVTVYRLHLEDWRMRLQATKKLRQKPKRNKVL